MTDPFYLDKETNAPHYYSVGKKTQDMVLYAKFNLKEESSFRNRMIGGVFTGSNHSDFRMKIHCLLYKVNLIV